ncbi:MAG: non-homologous end-joining DNA ligase [Dichotomicrobium sp.]
MSDTVVEIDGHEIAVSNRDKLFFPKDGITKGELVDYYRRIADTALPHYRGRPLSMQRFPDGITAEGFFQKNASDYFPGWIDTAELTKEDGTVRHVVVNSPATLVYLADQGMITPHLGLSRVDDVDRPDRLIFDLDPSDNDFTKVQAAAARLREAFEALEATPFVQTTGSRGLHVVVPLDRSADFDTVRDGAQHLARILAERHPDDLTVAQRKAKRGNRIYLDTARNAYGQTAVAPYGVRARPGAPVATPLDWDEALAADMAPQKYALGNIFRRLGNKDDPWRDIARAAISADTLAEHIKGMRD